MKPVETLILGAGPAGLQLAYLLESRGRDYLVLERATPGSFFKQFPRHRKLLSINKLYTGFDDHEKNLRWDWNSLLCDDPSVNLGTFSEDYFPHADALVSYLEYFAERFKLKIRCGSEVTRVRRSGSGFELHTADESYRCERLVVATGVSLPYVPEIEGIELAENYVDMSLERREFANQSVLILGKGNSGFETANHLVSTAAVVHLASPRPVRLAWQSRYVGDLRAVNNDFLDTYRLKSQNAVIDASVVELRRKGNKIHARFDYLHAPGEVEELAYDRVLVCTGFRFDASIFDADVAPDLTLMDRFPAQTAEWESSNVPHLYFAGTLMQARDFKRTMSGFIHGFRYNVQTLFHIMEAKYRGVPLPNTEIPNEVSALTHHIVQRLNRSSGLWQQPSFLSDVIVLGSTARHYRELPSAWPNFDQLAKGNDYLLLSLEFGSPVPNPFDFVRPHRDDYMSAAESEALHPVLRRYRRGKLLSTHHTIEDIAADWSDRAHVEPLAEYLTQALTGIPGETGHP